MSVQTLTGVAPVSAVRPTPLTDKDLAVVDRLTGWNIGVATAALSVGLLLGVLQGLEHAGFDFYPYIAPAIATYYHGLTIHGVLNALVWTTFFICGFFTFSTVRSLGRPLRYPWLNQVRFT
ncbi:MAG: cbb3-type cytochrome c oxidase subunit I [Caldilineaceae bacterium]